MEKKIIAVACVLVILAVTLAACGSKYLVITDEHGYTHLAVTDAEGNTVLDENGDIQVYVTDESGDPVTLENGAYDIGGIPFPSLVSDGDTIETPEYTLTMPDGWEADERGRFICNGNTAQYVEVVKLRELEENETIDTYFTGRLDAAETIVENIRQTYPAATISSQADYFTAKQIDSRFIETQVSDENGSVLYQSVNIYFVYEDIIYTISYATNAEGYDPDFDIIAVLNYNLVMK